MAETSARLDKARNMSSEMDRDRGRGSEREKEREIVLVPFSVTSKQRMTNPTFNIV